MEKNILQAVIKRNKVLDELIQINHLAITEFNNLDEQDWEHFLLTRDYLLKCLSVLDEKIILLSMMDWSNYKFSGEYRTEYRTLSDKKDEKRYVLIKQEKTLGLLKFGESNETHAA
jgi:hypothetical protein